MKKTLKRILATVLASIMLILSAPAANLLNGESVFSTKAAASESQEFGFDYLYNYINKLGEPDVDPNVKYVEFNIPDYEEYVWLSYNSELDVFCLYYEDDSYIDGCDYVNLYIDRDNTNYLCIPGSIYYDYDYDYDSVAHEIVGKCTVDASTFDLNNFTADVEIVECTEFFEDFYYDNNEHFSMVIANAISEINYVLMQYANIDLSVVGFDLFEGYCFPLTSSDLNGLLRNSYRWYYFTDGEIDYDFEGPVYNYFGTWYVKNGGIDFSFTGFAEVGNQYYVDYTYFKNGKAAYDFVGLAKNPSDGLWWYVDYGTIDYYYTGLVKNQYGWWYVKNGTIDFTYNGMAKNQYGWWVVENGKLNSKYNGMAKNQYGWWYFTNGKIDYKFNGLAKNQYGWWYIKNGTIDYKFKGLAKNQYGWWYVQNGTINFKYNGYASNQYGTWKVVNGKVVGK